MESVKDKIIRLALANNTKVIGVADSYFSKSTLECMRCFKRWDDHLGNLQKGKWCPNEQCKSPITSEIISILKDLNLSVSTSVTVADHTFDLAIESPAMQLIDLVETRDIGVKVEAANREGFNVIQINKVASLEVIKNNLKTAIEHVKKYIYIDVETIVNHSQIPLEIVEFNKINFHGKLTDDEMRRTTLLGQDSCFIDGGNPPIGVYPARIYARVSTEKQKEGDSMESQFDNAKRYAAEHKIHISGIYADVGISGGEMSTRPAMIKMRTDLKNGEKVIVASISRLSRNQDEAGTMFSEFKKKYIAIIALDTGGIPTDKPMGMMIARQQAQFSDQQRAQIAQNITTVMGNKAAKGELPTKPCYGWKVVAVPGQKPKKVPVEAEQQSIEKIKQIYLANKDKLSLRQICFLLDADFTIVKRKGNRWYESTVTRILEREDIYVVKQRQPRVKELMEKIEGLQEIMYDIID